MIWTEQHGSRGFSTKEKPHRAKLLGPQYSRKCSSTPPDSLGGVDQLDAAGVVGALGQRRRVGGDEDFDGWVHMHLPHVAAYRGAVAPSQDSMHMHYRLALKRSDVSDQRQHLD